MILLLFNFNVYSLNFSIHAVLSNNTRLNLYLYFQYNVCCCAPTRHSKFPVSENLLGSKSVSENMCMCLYIHLKAVLLL